MAYLLPELADECKKALFVKPAVSLRPPEDDVEKSENPQERPHSEEKAQTKTSAAPKEHRMRKRYLLAAFIIFFLLFPFVAQWSVNLTISRAVESFVAHSGLDMRVRWGKIHYNVWSQSLGVYDAVITRTNGAPVLKAKEMYLQGLSSGGDFPEELSVRVHGMQVAGEGFSGGKFGMTARLLDGLTGDMVLTGKYIPQEKRFTMDKMLLETDILGSIQAMMQVDNVTGESIGQVLKSIYAGRVTAGWVSVAGGVAAKRMVQLTVHEKKETPDKVLERIKKGIARRIDGEYAKDDRMRQNLIEISRYFEHPQVITARLADNATAPFASLLPQRGEVKTKALIGIVRDAQILISAR